MIEKFWLNLLYSDDIVSHKYHNNGKLDYIVTFSLTIVSNIVTGIFTHFINHIKILEERLELISEIKKEYAYLYAINKYIKILKLRMITIIISEIIIIVLCFYYIIIFFIVYSQSQKSLFINYLISLIEGLIKSIIVSIVVIILRKIGILYKNKYIYNTSKFIDENF